VSLKVLVPRLPKILEINTVAIWEAIDFYVKICMVGGEMLC
jgi:hypothetical protein